MLPPMAWADRPKVGLVLSGGGARGAAHIGVLRELERQRIPIDYIVGTSIGAIVGGLYASGYTPDGIEAAYESIDWADVFSDLPSREYLAPRRKIDNALFLIDKEVGIKQGRLKLPAGVIKGQKLYLELKELTLKVTGIDDFDRLDIPFRAVATDIATGETVVIRDGDLATAIRASMSLPAIFTPVELDGRLLVDGGISDNMPIHVAREMGADIVIAVDISAPLLPKEQLDSALSIISQLTGILTKRDQLQQLATLTERDILITPELGDAGAADFENALELVAAGEHAARAQAASLQALSVAEDDYGARLAATTEPQDVPPIIDFVRIENDSPIADELIRARLGVAVGEPLDTEELKRRIGALYGLDVFQSVRYTVVREDGGTGLVVDVREKPWGPDYLQFGLQLSTSDDQSSLGLLAGHVRTPVNRLNGEWRSVLRMGRDNSLLTELYQPLRLSSPYFALGQAFAGSETLNVVGDDGAVLSENRVRRLGASLALGREFGTWGQLQFGLRRFVGDVETRVGSPRIETNLDGGEFFGLFRLDTLDDANFPTNGLFGFAGPVLSRTGLGADQDFSQFRFDLFGARTWGEHTFQAGTRLLVTYSGEAPIQSRFRLGGLFDLPGFTDDELSGSNLALLRTGYMRPVSLVNALDTYAGVTLQLGNVYADDDDISFSDALWAGSAWLGADTVVGPAYLGYGVAEGGRNSLHFLLGRQF
jgi:NTE family protein